MSRQRGITIYPEQKRYTSFVKRIKAHADKENRTISNYIINLIEEHLQKVEV